VGVRGEVSCHEMA
jgi:hypothetical protein